MLFSQDMVSMFKHFMSRLGRASSIVWKGSVPTGQTSPREDQMEQIEGPMARQMKRPDGTDRGANG
jgi:hypothetical protein